MEDYGHDHQIQPQPGVATEQLTTDTPGAVSAMTEQEVTEAVEAARAMQVESVMSAEKIVSLPAQSDLEPGEIDPSPTQPLADLKRPLSPTAAASSSQENKRVRAGAFGVECLHCGCPAHRWTACMDKCSHCGQRHLGARCHVLPVESYAPGGFRPNVNYHPPGESLPALKLTPVDAAMPEYPAIEIDRPRTSDAKPAVPRFGEVSFGFEGGPAAVVPSIEAQRGTADTGDSKAPPAGGTGTVQCTPSVSQAFGTARGTANAPPQHDAPFPYFTLGSGNPTSPFAQLPAPIASTNSNPADVPDDTKMDAGRAALIAVTSDTDFQASEPAPLDPTLGPKSSGANDMPLGQRKPSTSAVPVKVEAKSQPTHSMWATLDSPSQSKPPKPQPFAPVANPGPILRSNVHACGRNAPAESRKATSNSHDAANKIMAVCGDDAVGQAAQQPFTFGFGTPAPAVPSYGQTLFGNGNSSVKTNAKARATVPPPNVQAANQAQNDRGVWNKLEQQIKEAVRNSARPGKKFNGTASRSSANAKVNEALGLLKPVILGATQPPSQLDFGIGQQQAVTPNNMMQQPGAQMPMQMPMQFQFHQGGNPSQPLPQPMQFQFHQGGTQPPQGMMVWNWAASAWQWVWQ